MYKLKKCDLLNRINKIRNKMIKVGLEKGLNDQNTIKISQELDALLNIYHSEYTSKPK
jgi:stage 0 sporulation regulatory protein